MSFQQADISCIQIALQYAVKIVLCSSCRQNNLNCWGTFFVNLVQRKLRWWWWSSQSYT